METLAGLFPFQNTSEERAAVALVYRSPEQLARTQWFRIGNINEYINNIIIILIREISPPKCGHSILGVPHIHIYIQYIAL